ncbi:arsenate reductase/protein-tyrosine-phosphatase family protein [Arenibacterium sp. CAU 1754]
METMLIDKLSVLSHPQRMAIFQLLVRRCPDALAAGEIAQVLDLKPSTASVYLSALTRSGLITQTRRGTFLFYKMNPESAQAMVSELFVDCCRGRPDLCPPLAPLMAKGGTPGRKHNVLFICSGNSARSIFAEAILRHEAGDRFTAYSAGTTPSPTPNLRALEMLRGKGLDTAGLRSKSLSEFRGPDAPKMDFVFTVCDQAANEDCPTWAGQPISAHWGVPDPVQAQGTDAERNYAFQEAFGALRNRIRAFTALPVDTLDRLSLQKHVDDIAQQQEHA